MPHADIKCTTDLDIDVKTLMSSIEKIILQLDPKSGVCKGRVIRIDEYHHSHLNVELRMFASKERDAEFAKPVNFQGGPKGEVTDEICSTCHR